MNTYFRSSQGLIKVEVFTNNIGIAQVETQLLATKNNLVPLGPVLAIINGGKICK